MARVASTETVEQIPIDQILVDPGQPRRPVQAKDLEALAESIRHVGVQVPLIVRPTPAKAKPPGVGECYTLVAGERRLRSAKAAGLQAVPAIVRELTDQEARTTQVVENLQRENLTALEEAAGYRSLLELGLSQADVGQRVGRTQAHVSSTVRLLELPAKVLEALQEGKLTARHARAFLPFGANPKLVERILQEINWEELHPAEDLEAELPWMIRRGSGDHVRPLTAEAGWGPKNPLGGTGALFRAGDAVPVKRLTPVLQKRAERPEGFYHPGPCTTCPHGFRAKTRDGLCLDPRLPKVERGGGWPVTPTACYDIRQAFAASGPAARKAAAAAGERSKLHAAGRTQRKKERERQAKAHGRWVKAVTRAQATFRRRPVQPRVLYLRALCEKLGEWQMRPDRIAGILGSDVDRLKVKPAAVKERPLPVLMRLSTRRLQEVLRTVYAVEDAGRRSWEGKSWPFVPPVKGLGGWGE